MSNASLSWPQLLGSRIAVHAHYWQTSTVETFLGFVEYRATKSTNLLSSTTPPSMMLQPSWLALALLGKDGVKCQYLSPYSPEFNRIETMWRLMKHRWLSHLTA